VIRDRKRTALLRLTFIKWRRIYCLEPSHWSSRRRSRGQQYCSYRNSRADLR